MHHRSTSKRRLRPAGLHLEILEERRLLSGGGDIAFHTGHSHTVLRNAAVAAVNSIAAAAPSVVVSPDATGADYPGAIWDPAASSNFSTAQSNPHWIVVHTTESTAASTISEFTTSGTQVSANYMVTLTGQVYQFVPDSNVAFHCGNLAYNTDAIGIEDERYGTNNVTEVEYEANAKLVDWLAAQYNIPLVHYAASGAAGTPASVAPANPLSGTGGIIGHYQVPDPSNPTLGGGANHHTDPVNWNWLHYMSLVTGNTAPVTPTNSSPANNATGLSSTPTLTASAFVDNDSGSTQTASEWQVLNGATVVYDSGTDTTHFTSIAVPAGKLTNAMSYTWQVRYEDSYGDWSNYSTPTTFTVGTIAANQPPTLASISLSASTIAQGGTESISPTGVSDPDGTVAGVNYYLESNNTPGLQAGASGDALLASTSRPYLLTINTLSQAPGAYTVYAQSVDNLGATSTTRSATYTVTPAFTSIVAKATTDSNITVTWSAPPTGLAKIDVERSISGGQFIQVAILDGTTTFYADTGLTPGTAYAYRVRPASGRTTGSYVTADTIDTLLTGDIDGNGGVGPNDLAILLANFGTTAGATWDTGDFDANGKVDGNDLALLLANFGQSASIKPIP